MFYFFVAVFFPQVELKFPAPSKTGNYQYSVILRSDSYLGLDQIKPLKVTGCVYAYFYIVLYIFLAIVYCKAMSSAYNFPFTILAGRRNQIIKFLWFKYIFKGSEMFKNCKKFLANTKEDADMCCWISNCLWRYYMY